MVIVSGCGGDRLGCDDELWQCWLVLLVKVMVVVSGNSGEW